MLSKLKMNGWVDDLSAGTTDSHDLPYGARGFGFFKLIAKLTEEGLGNYDLLSDFNNISPCTEIINNTKLDSKHKLYFGYF